MRLPMPLKSRPRYRTTLFGTLFRGRRRTENPYFAVIPAKAPAFEGVTKIKSWTGKDPHHGRNEKSGGVDRQRQIRGLPPGNDRLRERAPFEDCHRNGHRIQGADRKDHHQLPVPHGRPPCRRRYGRGLPDECGGCRVRTWGLCTRLGAGRR